jgi:hypothetical protein
MKVCSACMKVVQQVVGRAVEEKSGPGAIFGRYCCSICLKSFDVQDDHPHNLNAVDEAAVVAKARATVALGPCPRCRKAYVNGRPDNFGSAPECAFKTGVFDSSNWQCQTMNELRDLVEDTAVYNDDQWAAVIAIPNDDVRTARVADFIILGWYKHRGRTEAAYMLDQDHPIMPLTLAVAEKVLAGKSRL